MKINEAGINQNAMRQIKDLMETSYDMIGTSKDTNYSDGEERGYMLMTLGEIKGIIDMAEAMKEVLKA